MRKDLIFNYINQFIYLIIRFLLIPVLVRVLGMEAYGVISFYYTVEVLMALMDFGMGATTAKILAHSDTNTRENRFSAVRRIELIYLSIALVVGTFLIIVAPLLSAHWLNISSGKLNENFIIQLMGILFFVSWPRSLYENILIGQNKLSIKNIVNIISHIFRTALILGFIFLWKSEIEYYFYAMIISKVIESITLRYFAYADSPKPIEIASFQDIKIYLHQSFHFSLLSIFTLIFFQLDKLYISKYFSAEALGNYNLSLTLPHALLALITPIGLAVFTRTIYFDKNQQAQHALIQSVKIVGIISLLYCSFLVGGKSAILGLWLGSQSQLINDWIYQNAILGILFYSLTQILSNLFMLNNKYLWLNATMAVALAVYLFSLWRSQSIIEVARSWTITSATLMIGLVAGFIYYFRNPGRELLKVVFSIAVIYIFGYVILYYSSEFITNQAAQILIYFVFIVISAFMLFKKFIIGILKSLQSIHIFKHLHQNKSLR